MAMAKPIAVNRATTTSTARLPIISLVNAGGIQSPNDFNDVGHTKLILAYQGLRKTLTRPNCLFLVLVIHIQTPG
jgi:hypothetical protein